MRPVLRRRAILHQRPPGDEQVLHVVEDGAGRRQSPRLQHGAETREHRGVDGVGLGVGSDRFGETTRLAWIDLGEGETGIQKTSLEGAMISAGGLKDDAGDGVRCKPFDQRGETFLVVAEACARAIGMKMDVEALF
jgi:hypothetical protein